MEIITQEILSEEDHPRTDRELIRDLFRVTAAHSGQLDEACKFATTVTEVVNELSDRVDYLRTVIQTKLEISDDEFFDGYEAQAQAPEFPATPESIIDSLRNLGVDVDRLLATDSTDEAVE